MKTFFDYMHLAVLTALIACVCGTKRHINCAIYELPDSGNKSLSVIHIRADSSEDSVHYLWSSFNLPSVIVARTATNTNVSVDIEKLKTFQSGAITFNTSLLAFKGLTISKFWQFSYEKDTDEIPDTSKIESLDLVDFQWSKVTAKNLSCSDRAASIKLNAFSDDEIFSDKGLLEIEFSVTGDEELAPEFPHLIFTGNSSQIKIELDNLYSSNSSRIRYGFEMKLFSPLSQTCSNLDCKEVVNTLISDEFSPGIFSDIDILSPCSKEDNEKGSFLSWKPVAYTSKEPSTANSSDAQLTSKCSSLPTTTVQSIAESFFNDQKNIVINAFNITFGTVGDGFYPKTKYVAWSLMIGTGVSVHSKLSLAVILFMTIGMSALMLFFVGGVTYYVIRWCRKRGDDDDALLGDDSIN
ncbi:glycosylated lysosomal membrane protein-like [Argiope bruennichi]|uniref:glycosylated lysosomal membrane protein-like n=1 Tax=Argiope bruennichi TaxID=94029 RepID=UPI0024948F69|nr:glycosylated lysosomal membrane protein-like [Argiope bruennichi]